MVATGSDSTTQDRLIGDLPELDRLGAIEWYHDE